MTIKTACIAATGGFDQSALAAGRSLRPVIDSVFPLADAAGAHARMDGGAHVGKIVLEVASA